MQTICKKFTFEAAHVVPGHPQCGNLHGHTWTVEIQLTGDVPIGHKFDFVVDFGQIKRLWEKIFVDIDHSLILGQDQITDTQMNQIHTMFGQSKFFVLMGYRMPTSENLASYLRNVLLDTLGLYKLKVRVWEGLTAWAEA